MLPLVTAVTVMIGFMADKGQSSPRKASLQLGWTIALGLLGALYLLHGGILAVDMYKAASIIDPAHIVNKVSKGVEPESKKGKIGLNVVKGVSILGSIAVQYGSQYFPFPSDVLYFFGFRPILPFLIAGLLPSCMCIGFLAVVHGARKDCLDELDWIGEGSRQSQV